MALSWLFNCSLPQFLPLPSNLLRLLQKSMHTSQRHKVPGKGLLLLFLATGVGETLEAAYSI